MTVHDHCWWCSYKLRATCDLTVLHGVYLEYSSHSLPEFCCLIYTAHAGQLSGENPTCLYLHMCEEPLRDQLCPQTDEEAGVANLQRSSSQLESLPGEAGFQATPRPQAALGSWVSPSVLVGLGQSWFPLQGPVWSYALDLC